MKKAEFDDPVVRVIYLAGRDEYGAASFRGDICALSVVRETPKTFTIRSSSFAAHWKQVRRLRKSEFTYYDTWAEAHEALIEKRRESVNVAERRLRDAHDALSHAKLLQDPTLNNGSGS